jgi:hypothetical protein
MAERKAKVRAIRKEERADFSKHSVGAIAAIDEKGRAQVSFPGNHGVPVRARSVLDTPARAGEHPQALVGAPVLLVFEQGDPNRPIIVGLLREELRPEPVRSEVSLDLGEERDVVVDGQRLVFEGKQEVLLRCGKSSVLLRRDGKVLIRGSHLVSRASGTNKIKGGSISLN